ncbi:MAG: hypothetical protein HKN50_07360 [Gammaproteobacteria bacterium]|nr:hypothetical protein [Gammaproteobacteria bacterium]
MAHLLGNKTPYVVSRLENQARKPCLNAVIVYCILFDVSLEEIIPGLYKETRGLVAKRLKGKESMFSNHKARERVLQKFCDEMPASKLLV